MAEQSRPDPKAPASYLTRRHFLTGVAGVSAAAIGPWPIAHANERLIVNALAGEQSDTTRKYVGDAFEKKFKVKILWDDTGTAAQDYAKIRATRGAPGWDVNASLTPAELILGQKEGFLETLTDEKVPNLKQMWPEVWNFLPRTGAPFGIQYLTLFYNPSKMEEPTSWLDYWQPGKRYGDKVKRRVVMVRPTNLISIYAMILGARAAGGGEQNMEPIWKMLKEVEPYIGYTAAQLTQVEPAMMNGEAWITPYWSTRAIINQRLGWPMKMATPKEGTVPLVSASAVPVGAKEKELAFAFINFRLEKDIHREFCNGYGISPTRSDMGTDWPKDFLESQLVTHDQVKKLSDVDSNLISVKRREWTLKWQEALGT